MGDPGVLVLEAVEVVAPERLLVPTPAQPPLVGSAAQGGDAAVEEALVSLLLLRRRDRRSDRGRLRRGEVNALLEGSAAGGEGEEDEYEGERPAGDHDSLHGRLSAGDTRLMPRWGMPVRGRARVHRLCRVLHFAKSRHR